MRTGGLRLMDSSQILTKGVETEIVDWFLGKKGEKVVHLIAKCASSR